MNHITQLIKQWGVALGFQQIGITDIDLQQHPHHLRRWLAKDYHGHMDYMARNLGKRCHPEELVPNTVRIISARLNYFPPAVDSIKVLNNPDLAYISRYALGRDYHKLMRKRLATLAKQIEQEVGELGYRVFADSAPVLEKALAEKSGLGWIGKNTLLLNRQAGSYFFLGEIFTDLPLPVDQPQDNNHCGRCSACLDVCPTNAFVGPYELDARRCISYLTIENKGPIPLALRPLIGNRIFGCDDCQLVCPWNRFAKLTNEEDFHPRHHVDSVALIDLFQWTEQEYLKRTEGSALRRAGYQGWLRNIAVALGNAPTSNMIIQTLHMRRQHSSELVREHVDWALAQHEGIVTK